MTALLVVACGRSPILLSAQRAPDAAIDGATHHGGLDAGLASATDATLEHGSAETSTDGAPPNDPELDGGRPPQLDGLSDRPATGADATDSAELDGNREVPSCASCASLPHVRLGAIVPCINGQCQVPSDACEDGFAHCTSNPADGCETDLMTRTDCGGCGRTCAGPQDLCEIVAGVATCRPPCAVPNPDDCGSMCTDLQTDPVNCGVCGVACTSTTSNMGCQQGKCVVLSCVNPMLGDCTAEAGCETALGTDQNCGACGDKSCSVPNTLFTCSNGGACDDAVCAGGFANCETRNPDCETELDLTSSGGCGPTYFGSVFGVDLYAVRRMALASDGSLFVTGTFSGTRDFDPSANVDSQTAGNFPSIFITKFNPDGSYGWTSVFWARSDPAVLALEATPSGGVVAAGTFKDAIDLDPGPALDIRFTASPPQSDAFVVNVAANGSVVWGRTLPGRYVTSSVVPSQAVADPSGDIYLLGTYSGEVDFDPGPGADTHRSSLPTGFVVRLTAIGELGWMRSIDNGACSVNLQSGALASDGNIWTVGALDVGMGCPLSDDDLSAPHGDLMIAKVTPSNAVQGPWRIEHVLGKWEGFVTAAGDHGSVYIGGMTDGLALVDFDPGPAVVYRGPANQGNGFVLKVGADGGFGWVRILSHSPIVSLASAPDGGVVAVGIPLGGIVARLSSDGSSVWSLGYPDFAGTRSVVSGGGQFAVSGTLTGTGDLDPGPGVDLITGDVLFISRFGAF